MTLQLPFAEHLYRRALRYYGARVERHHRPYFRNGIEVERREYTVAHKKYAGIRVIDDVHTVGSIEVMKYRHYYGAIRHHSHKTYNPVWGVTPEKRDFVAGLHAGHFKEQMQAGYAARKVAISDSLA